MGRGVDMYHKAHPLLSECSWLRPKLSSTVRSLLGSARTSARAQSRCRMCDSHRRGKSQRRCGRPQPQPPARRARELPFATCAGGRGRKAHSAPIVSVVSLAIAPVLAPPKSEEYVIPERHPERSRGAHTMHTFPQSRRFHTARTHASTHAYPQRYAQTHYLSLMCGTWSRSERAPSFAPALHSWLVQAALKPSISDELGDDDLWDELNQAYDDDEDGLGYE